METILWYKKTLKKSGRPIVVQRGNQEKHVKSISMKNVDIKMSFMNSSGKAKKAGATTVLIVTKHT